MWTDNTRASTCCSSGVRWCESRMVTKRTEGLAPAEGGRSQLARGGDALHHPDKEPSCNPAAHARSSVYSKGPCSRINPAAGSSLPPLKGLLHRHLVSRFRRADPLPCTHPLAGPGSALDPNTAASVLQTVCPKEHSQLSPLQILLVWR